MATKTSIGKQTTKLSTAKAAFKNFRQQADIDFFYRFVFENDLRHEALKIIRTIRAKKAHTKAAKKALKH